MEPQDSAEAPPSNQAAMKPEPESQNNLSDRKSHDRRRRRKKVASDTQPQSESKLDKGRPSNRTTRKPHNHGHQGRQRVACQMPLRHELQLDRKRPTHTTDRTSPKCQQPKEVLKLNIPFQPELVPEEGSPHNRAGMKSHDHHQRRRQMREESSHLQPQNDSQYDRTLLPHSADKKLYKQQRRRRREDFNIHCESELQLEVRSLNQWVDSEQKRRRERCRHSKNHMQSDANLTSANPSKRRPGTHNHRGQQQRVSTITQPQTGSPPSENPPPYPIDRTSDDCESQSGLQLDRHPPPYPTERMSHTDQEQITTTVRQPQLTWRFESAAEKPPIDWLYLSVCHTVCCCPLLGLIAIVMSIESRDASYNGM